MDTQFSVKFIENNRKEIVCEYFYEQSNPNYLKDAMTLIENMNLMISFEAPEGYKLYMDGIDHLPDYRVFDDLKGSFVKPSTTPYVLYDFDAKNSQYPYIPGTYFLTVVSPNGEEYNARLNVLSKQVDEDQHQLMVSDIELFLKGLSMDFSERRSIYYHQALELFGSKMADKYTYILSNKNKIINGLLTISKNRRYTVKKTYPVVHRAKAKRIDHRSMKYLITHPEQQSTIQAPQSMITYQTNENSWLKYFISTILKYVIEMKKICEIQREEKYIELIKEVNDLHFYVQQFLNEKWMLGLKKEFSNPVPMVFLTIGSYNVFYKVYRYLRNEEAEIYTGSSMQFHYKRTDVLYEIWGYLKLIESLMKTESFLLIKNWFKLNRKKLDDIIVPKSGEHDFIELQKENIILRIYYDEILPKAKENVGANRTLYNLNHNRPDCRIDVWKDGSYKGSLVIDFKYRKRYALWDDQLLSEDKEATKVMKQLVSYAEGMKTNTLVLNGKYSREIDRYPVLEAWAVYPQNYDQSSQQYELNDYDIRLIDLTPGKDRGHFEKLLIKRINELIER
ncbi:DUF2357 domain-containing protein [Psychrobacillus sp. NPDC093180]|uniref:DUF2357 domain-containing protein n=1 Tax=Psychrobacillus sp. NPDC093180 TaxID=3364489 RepID=UPI0037F98844